MACRHCSNHQQNPVEHAIGQQAIAVSFWISGCLRAFAKVSDWAIGLLPFLIKGSLKPLQNLQSIGALAAC